MEMQSGIERSGSMLVEASQENFEREISSPSQLVMVDFWGPQCGPCLALMPHVENLDKQYPEIKIVKVDASKNRRLCLGLRVLSLPTFLFYRDGREVARLAGDVTREGLTNQIEKALQTG